MKGEQRVYWKRKEFHDIKKKEKRKNKLLN